MPTYEYECGRCGHKWDLFQSITAKSVRKCPGCGALAAKRLVGTGAGVIFKGSGFYQTDYRSESYQKGAKAATEKPSSNGEKSKDTSASKDSSKSKQATHETVGK